MRILHILSSNKFSGAENVACDIIQETKNKQHYSVAYCSPNGPIKSKLEQLNIDYIPINTLSVYTIKQVVTKYSPDIIHAHDMRASFMSSLACGFNTKMIVHIHNNHPESKRLSLRSISFLIPAIRAKRIFWVSESSYNDYIFSRLIRRKSEVLQNVVNISELKKKAGLVELKNKFDIIFLGRLTFAKNPEMFLEVAEAVKRKINNVKIAIIGDGELKESIYKKTQEMGLSGNIKLFGYLNNPYPYLANAKLLVMTSRWEGTPMCALEAMALGIPIVSTPTDGLKKLVDQDETGYLADDVPQLAYKCIELLEKQQKYNKLKANTLKKIKKISNRNEYIERINRAYKL